ncbi:hypothetical protein ACOBV9_19475 (plasmid) [Pseudoalteromonas espejiana]
MAAIVITFAYFVIGSEINFDLSTRDRLLVYFLLRLV